MAKAGPNTQIALAKLGAFGTQVGLALDQRAGGTIRSVVESVTNQEPGRIADTLIGAVGGGAAGFLAGGPIGGVIGAGIGAAGGFFGQDLVSGASNIVENLRNPPDASQFGSPLPFDNTGGQGSMGAPNAPAWVQSLNVGSLNINSNNTTSYGFGAGGAN